MLVEIDLALNFLQGMGLAHLLEQSPFMKKQVRHDNAKEGRDNKKAVKEAAAQEERDEPILGESRLPTKDFLKIFWHV